MRKYLTIPLIPLFLYGCSATGPTSGSLEELSQQVASIELDADGNGAIDENKGGTNAQTFAAARTNLDVYSKSEADLADDDNQNASEVALDTTNFGGNLSSTENTLQKFADFFDDLSLGGGSALVDDIALAADWNSDLDGTSKNTLYDYFVIFDLDLDGDFTDESWFPATTGAPTGASYLTTTSEAGLSNETVVTAFGLSILDDSSEAVFKSTVNLEIGVDVQPYDVNMILWPSTVSSTEVGYLDGVTNFITDLLLAKEDLIVNEAGLYARLSDVSQFYEPGDTIQTASGTSLPGTCTVGQLYLVTVADTDGTVYVCRATNVWKDIDDDGGAGGGDVLGTATATDNAFPRFNADGYNLQNSQTTEDDSGNVTITGNLTVGGLITSAPVATPVVGFYDSDNAGADKYAASFEVNSTTVTDGAEVSDLIAYYMDAGTKTEAFRVDGSDNQLEIAILTTLQPNDISSAEISTIVESIGWNAGATSSDGTQCADPAEVTINSGPKLFTTICTDNDASTIFGSTPMPDSWDGGTVTMEVQYVQTAADTSALNGDIAFMCKGSGETIDGTYGTEVALDNATLTGSNAIDHTISAAATPAGTCAGGDTLLWRYQIDATGTTTAVASLHFLEWKMEYTSNVGD